MGASQSRTVTDIINQSIIDVLVENNSSCPASVKQQQTVIFTGKTVGAKVEQKLQSALICLQDAKTDNRIYEQIANLVHQRAVAEKKGLLPGMTRSDAISRIRNYLETNLTNRTLQECSQSLEQSQKVVFGGETYFADVSQALNSYTECMQRVVNTNKLARQISTEADQEAEAVAEGLGTWTILAIAAGALLFLIIAAAVIYGIWRWNRKVGKKMQPIIGTVNPALGTAFEAAKAQQPKTIGIA